MKHEEYLAIPDAKGNHLYFPASMVMEVVNKEWEPLIQRTVDRANSPNHAAMLLAKMKTPKYTARILSAAYTKLIETGKGLSREKAVEVAVSLLDAREIGNGKTKGS